MSRARTVLLTIPETMSNDELGELVTPLLMSGVEASVINDANVRHIAQELKDDKYLYCHEQPMLADEWLAHHDLPGEEFCVFTIAEGRGLITSRSITKGGKTSITFAYPVKGRAFVIDMVAIEGFLEVLYGDQHSIQPITLDHFKPKDT